MLNPFASARFLMSAAQLEQAPAPDWPEVAFAGRSNAGKSSALNRICTHKGLARVSKTPGRTQLLNFFDVPGGRFVDLPGYGFAQVPLQVRRDWGRLVTGYIESRRCLRGIVLVMDARHPLTDFDRQMLSWSRAQDIPCHVLLTKADKLKFAVQKKTLAEVARALPQVHAGATVQLFSSEDGMGVEEVRQLLTTWLAEDPVSATSL
jgi:GTP-binding protein